MAAEVTPVHLAVPGARKTLCGLGDRKGPTTPYRSLDAPPRLPGAETICSACVAVRWPATTETYGVVNMGADTPRDFMVPPLP